MPPASSKWLGRRLGETLVRPVLVEVRHVRAGHTGEVALAEDEQAVEALAALAVLFGDIVALRRFW